MSTSRCQPLGIATDSPSSGGKSPPQVSVSDHKETQVNVNPYVAALPKPSIVTIASGESGTYGLSQVKH